MLISNYIGKYLLIGKQKQQNENDDFVYHYVIKRQIEFVDEEMKKRLEFGEFWLT